MGFTRLYQTLCNLCANSSILLRKTWIWTHEYDVRLLFHLTAPTMPYPVMLHCALNAYLFCSPLLPTTHCCFIAASIALRTVPFIHMANQHCVDLLLHLTELGHTT